MFLGASFYEAAFSLLFSSRCQTASSSPLGSRPYHEIGVWGRGQRTALRLLNGFRQGQRHGRPEKPQLGAGQDAGPPEAENPADEKQLEAVGVKRQLPRDLLSIVQPNAANLPSFGGIDFDSLQTTLQSPAQAFPRPAQCRIM
ncbi:uncharacterized protein LOC117658863 isoform X2 [Pantherophis guttatus]|uniref:Uncharacterized protein LOC117658863 isoform X2 n=1 Tax=Pantherophis guttatus TaxID=94885 RepID=A0ABM3YY69_PANGU|nr:uncharacterized protein LOC117658863 isoform X2 [Pantherophis guttatus]